MLSDHNTQQKCHSLLCDVLLGWTSSCYLMDVSPISSGFHNDYTLQSTHCTLHTAVNALHVTHCTLHTAVNTLQAPNYTLHTARYTLHTTNCRLQNTRYIQHATHSTLHTASYTLQLTHCTLDATHCRLQQSEVNSRNSWKGRDSHLTKSCKCVEKNIRSQRGNSLSLPKRSGSNYVCLSQNSLRVIVIVEN